MVKQEFDANETPEILRDLFLAYKEANNCKKEVEKELEEYKIQIQDFLAAAHADAIKTPYGSVGWQAGRTTKSIDPKKLLELGVSAKVVEEATVVTVGEKFLRVNLPREKGEEGS